MKMSFFAKKKASSKKLSKKKSEMPKNGVLKTKAPSKPFLKKRTVTEDNDAEEIASDTDEESEQHYGKRSKIEEKYSESDDETPQDKKLRMTKEILSKMRKEIEEKDDDDDDFDGQISVGKDYIGERLKRDILERTGKLERLVADQYLPPEPDDIRFLRSHKLSVTCAVIAPAGQSVFSASKDCSIIKWDVVTGKKLKVIARSAKDAKDKSAHHSTHVLCLAISSDGKFLASGDRSNLVLIWNASNCEKLHMFRKHRGAVTGLAFRKDSHQLFSASHDRLVIVWNLDEMSYVETMFGHVSPIAAADSLKRERVITCGGNDVHLFKVVEETQLVFHGNGVNIDCVSLINEDHFITGADNNSISLWHTFKKKPLVTVHDAHSPPGDSTSSENWITSVAALHYTNLVASGSKDGSIRLWKCGPGYRSLNLLFSIPMPGFVNSLRFSTDGSLLVASLGQENRLGRWWSLKGARNGVALINLRKKAIVDNRSGKT